MATWVTNLTNGSHGNSHISSNSHVTNNNLSGQIPNNHLSAGQISLSPADAKPKLGNIECGVCGDKSSGKHYGVFTCEGKS